MGNVAVAVLTNKENKLLLYLRDNKPTIDYPNNWGLLGGHIEENESPLEALKRELKEEIDYEIENPIFIACFDDKVGNICHIYKDRINRKLSELTLTEGQRLGYFTLEDALKMSLPPPLRDFFIEYRDKLFME